MNEHKDWKGKTAKIEILKNGSRLYYTASNIIIKDGVILFDDRTGSRFGFPVALIQQMQEIPARGGF